LHQQAIFFHSVDRLDGARSRNQSIPSEIALGVIRLGTVCD
jgi:hypothetical protein